VGRLEAWWGARPRGITPAFVDRNAVSLLRDGAECFPAMLDAIARAEHEVLLEMYWFGSDDTGWRFARALMERARAGVRVAVIYDSVGSFGEDGAMFAEMRAAGCVVHEFNAMARWKRRALVLHFTIRDHRKILVVDGRVAFTGGINLAHQWAPENEGGGNWRDDGIRVDGPAALEMRTVFLATWREVGEPEFDDLPPHAADWSGSPEWRGSSSVSVLASTHRRDRRDIRDAYLLQIRKATQSVFITNSYFVPDPVVRAALSRAARRGVDVRVLVPGKSDIPAAYWAGRHSYDRLLRAGVRIFEWQGRILHSKTAVIDGLWSTVGSFNLDYLSWRRNREVNVAVVDAAFADTVRGQFEDDLKRSKEVTRAARVFRSLGERFVESFWYMFRKIL
jgi:cardiolipin synthase